MEIAVLGPLEVREGTATIEVSGARLRQLLTCLALEVPRAVSAPALVDALWGDEPPADETNALQSLVSRLRRTLGDAELIQQSPAGYRLALDPTAIDVHRFTELSANGRSALRRGDLDQAHTDLTKAVALWRGDLAEAAENAHADALAARLDEQCLDARADLAEAQIRLGRAAIVIPDLEGLVAAHPVRERFTALLMRALVADSRQAEALTAYDRTRELLAGSLGIDPSGELRAAHLDALRADTDTTSPDTVGRSNLRATLTSFVGRDEQLAQIGDLLATSRLVTLVGPGGAGKTRLATASATAIGSQVDGIWLAELAPVTDPADIGQTVLGALGIRDVILLERSAAPRDVMTRLVDALAPRDAVLVLDNCEHLIDAAAVIVDALLAQCPRLRILTTSREPLGITGESLVVVPPLGQPDADATPDVASGFPAVQLFADRARDVSPDFVVDESTVAAVIEIVRRLDGLPLAIELAAARLRSLPVTEIARRLSDRFRLLTGGSRTAMPRHRTLRAVVEWSWDLLSEPEQLLTERLAVFSGGISPAAASAVCAGGALDADLIDDLMTSLVDKSLLQAVPSYDDRPRYRMLETIREFGVERMAARGEVGAIRLAHAEHFHAVAAEADPHLRRREQLSWMALLGAERDNVLAALKYFVDDGRAAQAVDLVTQLGWYWMTLGNHSDIITWVSFALATPGDVDPAARLMCEAFYAINSFAWNVHGSDDEVEAGLGRLKEITREITAFDGPKPPMMRMLAPVVAMFVGDTENLPELTERAVNDEDPWVAAAIRTFRASMAENDGDPVSMRKDAEEAVVIFRELGERWGIANSLQVLGQLELMEGNLDSAAAAYREGIEMATEVGSREDMAMMRLRLADILTRQGDRDGAEEQAELARQAARGAGSPYEVLFTHVVQVEIYRGRGELDRAREFYDAAVDQLEDLPTVHPIRSHGLAMLQSSGAKIDIEQSDLDGALERLRNAWSLALDTKDMPIVASVAVAVAMLAERTDRPAVAAEILGAAAQLRGADDATATDIAALATALGGLTDGPHADAYHRGRGLSREKALARVDPATLA